MTGMSCFFAGAALPEDAFQVLRVEGEERLSGCYRFRCLLGALPPEVDETALLDSDAVLRLDSAAGPVRRWNGLLSEVEEVGRRDGLVLYQVVLRPRFSRLDLNRHNRVFVDATPREFLHRTLCGEGLTPDVDFSLDRLPDWPARPFVCQYNESCFAFISRWLEHLGLTYRFDQQGEREKLLAAEAQALRVELGDCRYRTGSANERNGDEEAIVSFVRQRSLISAAVALEEYNPLKPDLDLTCRARVPFPGRGELRLYNPGYEDPTSGGRLARIRAEELACGAERFSGISTLPALCPGAVFRLVGHARPEWNAPYTVIAVRHEAVPERQENARSEAGSASTRGLTYRNSFVCLPASTPFRPARTTPKPRIGGVMTARIDAAGSGSVPELDEHGRYKIRLPFDADGREDGKNSCPLRRMQPYAGENMGFHAPLCKGTEVTLIFEDGDPDRPAILGALTNTQDLEQTAHE